MGLAQLCDAFLVRSLTYRLPLTAIRWNRTYLNRCLLFLDFWRTFYFVAA